jgi:putative transposase
MTSATSLKPVAPPLAVSQLQSGVRFRAYPSVAMAQALSRWIGCQRFVYNGKVGEDQLFQAQRRMDLRDYPFSPSPTPLDNTYRQFKNAVLSPWLSEVPSPVLRQAACRWRAAKQRQLAGLAKAPRKRNPGNFTSVLLDADMFCFKPVVHPQTGVVQWALHLGGEGKYALGVLPFKAHRPFGLPKMLSVSRKGDQWFVSFSYAHESKAVLRTPQELAYEANRLSDAALSEATVAFDRNVKDNALYGSNGQLFMLEDIVLQRMARRQARTQRYQRRYARCQRGSHNQARARDKVAKSQQYKANALRDFSHQTSHAIVDDRTTKVIGFEALKLANMVRAPKAKRDPSSGAWQRNGARAKAGLNRLLLSRALGSIVRHVRYKAARQNKLVVEVAPHYSSQACSRCGHTHPDNRRDQRFVCQECHFTAHADANASLVLKKRTIAKVRSGALEAPVKAPKRIAVRRKVAVEGAGCSGLSVEPS